MKRSHALVLATTLAAGLGQAASATVSRQAGSPARSALAGGKIGTALPSADAAARIRALGLDDGGGIGSDDRGLTASRHAAHGTIGSAGPSPNAAGRIAALGLDE